MKDLSTTIYKLVHDSAFRIQLQEDVHAALAHYGFVLNNAEVEALCDIVDMLQLDPKTEADQALKDAEIIDIFWSITSTTRMSWHST